MPEVPYLAVSVCMVTYSAGRMAVRNDRAGGRQKDRKRGIQPGGERERQSCRKAGERVSERESEREGKRATHNRRGGEIKGRCVCACE